MHIHECLRAFAIDLTPDVRNVHLIIPRDLIVSRCCEHIGIVIICIGTNGNEDPAARVPFAVRYLINTKLCEVNIRHLVLGFNTSP